MSEPVAKRGPGRPRKPVDPTKPKRPRGRPPKGGYKQPLTLEEWVGKDPQLAVPKVVEPKPGAPTTARPALSRPRPVFLFHPVEPPPPSKQPGERIRHKRRDANRKKRWPSRIGNTSLRGKVCYFEEWLKLRGLLFNYRQLIRDLIGDGKTRRFAVRFADRMFHRCGTYAEERARFEAEFEKHFEASGQRLEFLMARCSERLWDHIGHLPNNAEQPEREYEWVRSHPAMMRQALGDVDKNGRVTITVEDILDPPNGSAPSKAAVILLFHHKDNPEQFWKGDLQKFNRQAAKTTKDKEEKSRRTGVPREVSDVVQLLEGLKQGLMSGTGPGDAPTVDETDAENERGVFENLGLGGLSRPPVREPRVPLVPSADDHTPENDRTPDDSDDELDLDDDDDSTDALDPDDDPE